MTSASVYLRPPPAFHGLDAEVNNLVTSLCPGENTLAAFAEGAIEPTTVAGLERHLAACDDCLAAVAALAGAAHGKAVGPSFGGTAGLAQRLEETRAEALLPVSPGQIFADRYRIGRYLAKGGHGAVFAAEHVMTEAPVALKVLWQRSESPLSDAEAIAQEARLANRAQSDYIVRVLDAGIELSSATPYLAMELLDGHPLSDVVTRRGPLDVGDATLYLSHVAQGLDGAHGIASANGTSTPVVHRDLKPENLFLTARADGRPLVKILDFGLAKVARANGTITGTVCGTPCYMANEQITCGAIGPYTDVWAYGLVTFYLLTGRRYWLNAQPSNFRPMSVLAEVLHEPLVPPSTRASQLQVSGAWSPAFDRWFLGCVNRDPRARFQSAGSAYTALVESLLTKPSALSWSRLSGRRRHPQLALGPHSHGNFPLGAHWDGNGVSFALFSQHATCVDLCLYDPADHAREVQRIRISQHRHHVWQTYAEGVRPGQPYGYRVHGPFAPHEGQRFNPNKLLMDPYARWIAGPITWNSALFAHAPDAGDGSTRSDSDSAPFTARSVVIDAQFPWGDDRPPQTPWSETLIYEAHVKGMTMTHPDVPERLRGTFLGLASDPIIDHLLELGVTAIELLPAHQAAPDRSLEDRGLRNYWGYQTIGYFAPDSRYATKPNGDVVAEFKAMVRAFHRAKIEVLLDVVYNHTAEGDHLGPTLCFRGLDNSSYYRLVPEDPSQYENHSACGNTVSLQHPRALQLVLDSLRYWVQEMHVDGFRFDLGPILARETDEFDPRSRFLAAVQQDPVLRNVKLIAEPWDCGPNGYRLGAFPSGWSEWNDRYRDCVRRFWRGDFGQLTEFAARLSGSPDLFAFESRGVEASINFVTCHDGFTLRDLVSYERPHNQLNLDGPGVGLSEHLSANWGEEGPTAALEIIRQRDVMQKNFLATLALSAGVPMLLHGDEIGRTQRGNSNAYCHDSELVWMNWELDERQQELLFFTRDLFAIARAHPELREALGGTPKPGSAYTATATWQRADGSSMTEREWQDGDLRAVAVRIDVVSLIAAASGKVLVLAINASSQTVHFSLPSAYPEGWHELLNSARERRHPTARGALIAPRSLALFFCASSSTPSVSHGVAGVRDELAN